MTLLEYLRRFNRKERFSLVGRALGNPLFRLQDAFRGEMEAELGLHIPADDCFVAMDYHLDWIQVSLFLHRTPKADIYPNAGVLTGNQEDVDLLLAFEDGPVTHLIMIEAKVETGWKNDQSKSKADRLKLIFGEDGLANSNVQPHFLLMSPKRPTTRLDTSEWPRWMLADGASAWLELARPRQPLIVTRTGENESGTFDSFVVSGE